MIKVFIKTATSRQKIRKHAPVAFRIDYFIALLLVLATLSVYYQINQYAFIHIDDNQYVYENRFVRQGLTLESISWAFTELHSVNWHPLTWLSHILDVTMFGVNSGPHHITNLFFHIANVLLLFCILKKMTGQIWQSGFVAALFALHPLHVESVAWISERKDVLFAFFWMMTIGSYIRYWKQPKKKNYAIIVLFFTMGLMSKPMIVTLPFVLLLLDFWPLKRICLQQPLKNNELQEGKQIRTKSKKHISLLAQIFRLILEKTPLFLLSGIISVITIHTQTLGKAVVSIEELSFKARVGNAIVAYSSYIGKMLWPLRLTIFYPQPGTFPLWEITGAGFLLAIFSFLAIQYRKRQPYLPVGWFWYLGTLVPVIGLVQVGGQAMADRYTYIPLIGLYIIITWSVSDILKKLSYRKTVLTAMAVVTIFSLAITTNLQIKLWKNSVCLFKHTLNLTSDNYFIHNNLGTALMRKGRFKEALRHYQMALQIYPDFELAVSNMGLVYAMEGKTSEAIEYYLKALRIDPELIQTRIYLGTALRKQNKQTEAIQHYYDALKKDPDNTEVHYNLGVTMAEKKDFDRAIQHFNKIIELNYNYLVVAHYKLGNIYSVKGKLNDAINHYNAALNICPDFQEALNNIGIALIRKGNVDQAIFNFQKALQINTGDARAQNNLKKALLVKLEGKKGLIHIK